MKLFKLAFAVPSGHTWEASFGMCLVSVALALGKHPIPGYAGTGLKLENKRGSVLCKSRQDLVLDAIASDCSHILFVDSDQTFPPHIVHLLARHRKPVVACNVATKSLPSCPTARMRHPTWPGGEPLYSTPESPKLERVWRVGTGVMLVDLEVFRDMPKPWFLNRWVEEIQDFGGEDWYFNEKLDELGIPIYVDHEASLHVGHIGPFEFKHEHVERKEERNAA